jgi:acyl-CoA thioester hydrolase
VNSKSFSHCLRVRYSECDPQGVVFNGWYLFYYDVALTEFHRAALGSYGEFARAGQEIVVAQASLRYRAAARFDDWLAIELSLVRLGRTSLTFRGRFTVEERPIADADVRHVVIEAASGERTPIPLGARRRLEPFVCSQASA